MTPSKNKSKNIAENNLDDTGNAHLRNAFAQRQARRQPDFRCFAFRWPVDVNDAFANAQQREFYARRCAARDRRFAHRQMDVDSRSAFAILSAASASNVAP
jgi:hypothetical protein